MTDRLHTRDLAILAQESVRTPMHNSTLEIFDPGASGLDYDALVAHVDDRIAFVPRYRQKLRHVPGGLANPVWIDDPDFDLNYHVRRSALPRPGTREQLRDLVARIVSRRLDRDRPLWEMYVVEGLEGGLVALLSKSHQVLVDGVRTVDIGQVLLDVDPAPRPLVVEGWTPRPLPERAGAGGQGAERQPRLRRRPRDGAQHRRRALRRQVEQVASLVGSLVPGLPRRSTGAAYVFNVEPSEQRRVVLVRTALKDYRKVRRVHGGTVNDVILATVAGAVRGWLMTRAESVNAGPQAAGPGADERDRRGARAHQPGQHGHRAPAEPAGG